MAGLNLGYRVVDCGPRSGAEAQGEKDEMRQEKRTRGASRVPRENTANLDTKPQENPICR